MTRKVWWAGLFVFAMGVLSHAQITTISGPASQAQGNVFLVGSGAATTANKLVKLDSTGLAIATLTTSDKTFLGVAQTTVSAGGYVTVLTSSTLASCVFDGTTTIGHFVTISTSVAGDCADTGTASSAGVGGVTAGTTIVGVVQSVVTVGNAAPIQLYGAGSQSASSSGGGITLLTGDGTTPAGGGSQPLTLATVNGSPGACGDATHVSQVVVNGKGLTTSCTPVTITAGSSLTTQTNSVNNSSQTTLNVLNGGGVTATNTSGGNVQLGLDPNVISNALSTAFGIWPQGDSICAGTGASNPYTNGFAYISRSAIGGFFKITCRPGDQLIDTTSVYVNTNAVPINGSVTGLIEDGTNDVTQYGTSANLQTSWQEMYAADVYTQAIAFTLKAYPAASLTGWSSTGSWAGDSTQNSVQPDYVSTTNGNTLTYTGTCSPVSPATTCAGVFDYPMWNANGGTFTLSLNGTPLTVPYGGGGTTFYNAGFNGSTITAASSTASTFSKGAVRMTIPSGAYTVVQTVTSSTSSSNKVGVSYFAVVPTLSASNPNVVAMALAHQNNANDTLSGTYSGYISSIVTQAVTDGVNAYFANERSALLNTNVDIKLYVAATGTSFAATGWQNETSACVSAANCVSYASTAVPLVKVSSGPTQGQYAVTAGTYTFNIADAAVPLNIAYTINCGTNTTAMFANCYADALHPNDYGHAVYAATLISAIPAALVTGNNLPQTTSPFRNYITTGLFPQQMMTPNAFNLASVATGFMPGIAWYTNVNQAYFTTDTSNGITEVGPFGVADWSVASFNSTGQPTGNSQLTTLLKESTAGGTSIFTSNNARSNFMGLGTFDSSASSVDVTMTLTSGGYSFGNVPTLSLINNNGQGQADINFNGTGTQLFRLGSTGSSVVGSNCTTINDSFFLANYTSGSCVPILSVPSTNVMNFLVAPTILGNAICVSTGTNCPSGSGVTLQTNGVNNTTQTALNFITSTVNATGLTITPSNPATSSEKMEITGNVSNASLASQTANTVLGALTATTPSGLAVPPCSGASSALTWTSGTGFGCNTLTVGVSSVSNSDGTLNVSPTTGAVVASLNLAHSNTPTGAWHFHNTIATYFGTADQATIDGAGDGSFINLANNGTAIITGATGNAGSLSLTGNTALAGLTSNTAAWIAPNSASFTAYGLQLSATAPSGGGQIMTVGAPSSGTSQVSFTTALPNGITATTQTVGDNSTKVATTAFVLANAGGGGVTGSGTAFGAAYWTASGTIAGLASPPTGTLWWLGTGSAPRASTTSDSAALSISGTAALATSIAGGGSNEIPYNTAAGVTAFSSLFTFTPGTTLLTVQQTGSGVGEGICILNSGSSRALNLYHDASGNITIDAANTCTTGSGGRALSLKATSVIASGPITSALGNAAITSATGGTGITSVTCATAACTVSRGSYTIVGGTATTGTIATLVWPTTTTAWVCSVDENGGVGFLGIGHGVATATGMTITAGVTVLGVTFTVDYNCVP